MFGEHAFITYLTLCPRQHHGMVKFARQVLVERLRQGNLRFYCYECDEAYDASVEQKAALQKLLRK